MPNSQIKLNDRSQQIVCGRRGSISIDLHDLLLVVPELVGVGHVLVGHPEHVGGDPAHRHPEHHQQLHDVAGLQRVNTQELHTSFAGGRECLNGKVGSARGGSREGERRRLTSRPDLRPTPKSVTPRPMSSTSFLVYPNGACKQRFQFQSRAEHRLGTSSKLSRNTFSCLVVAWESEVLLLGTKRLLLCATDPRRSIGDSVILADINRQGQLSKIERTQENTRRRRRLQPVRK